MPRPRELWDDRNMLPETQAASFEEFAKNLIKITKNYMNSTDCALFLQLAEGLVKFYPNAEFQACVVDHLTPQNAEVRVSLDIPGIVTCSLTAISKMFYFLNGFLLATASLTFNTGPVTLGFPKEAQNKTRVVRFPKKEG